MTVSRPRLCAALLAALVLLASPAMGLAAAKPAKPEAPQPPAQPLCRGADMLPELAISDPALHEKIIRDAATTENGGALLWKLERPGIPSSYLFGTVHLTDPRVAQLPPNARNALGRVSTVVLEVADLSPQSSALALSAAMRFAIFTDGSSLDKLISADEFAKVKQTVSRAGIPAETARLFKPWIVSMLMSGTECERRNIQDGGMVLDMRIAEVAKRRGVPIAGLETIDAQLEAMATVPEQQQIDMLRSSLRYADRTQDLVETTLQFYLKRNIGGVWPFQLALARKAGFADDAFAGFQQQLIIGRNLKMRDRAMAYLDKGGAFVAVGALHLPGKSGLVTLLRERGFTVTPIE